MSKVEDEIGVELTWLSSCLNSSISDHLLGLDRLNDNRSAAVKRDVTSGITNLESTINGFYSSSKTGSASEKLNAFYIEIEAIVISYKRLSKPPNKKQQ